MCEQCGSKENIVIGTNPFKSSENLWLCNDCQFIEFSKLKNVKNFDPFKLCCEGTENFKFQGVDRDCIVSRLSSQNNET